MLLCVCKAVSDREIARVIAEGARSEDEVVRCTGAGTECGSCRDAIASAVAAACPSGGCALRRDFVDAERPSLVALRLAPLAIPA